MSVFVIEHGIPLPRKGKRPKLPSGLCDAMRGMAVGDSIAAADGELIAGCQSWARAITGWTFARRRMDDGTTRIWRTA